MPEPPTTLRAASPTLAEGHVFARYLDMAAEGFFRFLLGRRSAEILAEAFLQPGHDLSYEHVTFAECEGVAVGMVSGYTATQHRQSSKRPLREAAGRFPIRLAIVATLFAPLFRIIETIADDDYYLLAIAVDPEHRGRGIASTLMDFLEDRAMASGAARLALDVSATNDAARSLYERRGMTIASQWPKRLPLPKLRFYRMTKALRTPADRGSL